MPFAGIYPVLNIKIILLRKDLWSSIFILIRFWTLQTFDAYVSGNQSAPGIVVLQEWWGVDYEVKNNAALIANKGFRTLIPEYGADLYQI